MAVSKVTVKTVSLPMTVSKVTPLMAIKVKVRVTHQTVTIQAMVTVLMAMVLMAMTLAMAMVRTVRALSLAMVRVTNLPRVKTVNLISLTVSQLTRAEAVASQTSNWMAVVR
jgi:hypothetical protein